MKKEINYKIYKVFIKNYKVYTSDNNYKNNDINNTKLETDNIISLNYTQNNIQENKEVEQVLNTKEDTKNKGKSEVLDNKEELKEEIVEFGERKGLNNTMALVMLSTVTIVGVGSATFSKYRR